MQWNLTWETTPLHPTYNCWKSMPPQYHYYECVFSSLGNENLLLNLYWDVEMTVKHKQYWNDLDLLGLSGKEIENQRWVMYLFKQFCFCTDHNHLLISSFHHLSWPGCKRIETLLKTYLDYFRNASYYLLYYAGLFSLSILRPPCT